MKTCILTTHFNYNYGAILQAYATSKVVEKIGLQPVFPNYNPPYYRQPTYWGRGWQLKKYGMCTAILRGAKQLPRMYAFDQFRKAHLPIDSTLNSLEAVRNFSRHGISTYLVGSDNVWNTNWIRNEDLYFFLGFLNDQDNVRRVSYGTCFGGEKQTNILEQAGQRLGLFNEISVRNRFSKKIAEQYAKREIHLVVDPTLLHDFKEFCPDLTRAEPFILLYACDESRMEMAKVLTQALKAKTKLPIVCVASEDITGAPWVDKYVSSACPRRWLDLINKARYVVTDSFHGCCFAIKFQRNFIAYTSGWRSHRLSSLLEPYGLMSRLLVDEVISGDVERVFQRIEYDKVAEVLQTDIRRSSEYLEQALDC